MQFVKVESKLKIVDRLATLKDILLNWDYENPCKLVIEKYTDPRTRSQNSLAHMWFSHIAKEYKIRGYTYTHVEHKNNCYIYKATDEELDGESSCCDCNPTITEKYVTGDDMKIIMKHMFLGYEDVVIGKVRVKKQLVSTASLSKGEMTHFLDQVYNYALNQHIFLPIPANSDYKRNKDRQNGY